jgi:hypothetical protein
MQWYIYLITIAAAVFLWQIAVEFIKPPLVEIARIRRLSLQWIAVFSRVPLPKPRELAITSIEIREHDRAVKNVKEAQRILLELGRRLFVLAESEPAIRIMIGFLGLDLFAAAHRLIILSDVFAAVTSDSVKLREVIATATRDARAALTLCRQVSRDHLVRLRLEPMNLSAPGNMVRTTIRPAR